jgi:tyrosine-protein kinase Etk/Wzc
MSSTHASAPPVQKRQGVDIDRLLGIVSDNKWTIAVVTAIFAVAGLIFALMAEPEYRADMLVQIESSRAVNPLEEVTTLLGKEPPSQSEIEIIRSRGVLGRAVDILGLTLQVEPRRFPVLGGFLVRRGVQRPEFLKSSPYTWAGESIHVAALAVDSEYLGVTFVLEIVDSESYALYKDKERLGVGEIGKPHEFLGGSVSVTIDGIEAPPGAQFRLTQLHRSLAISQLRESLRINEQGRDTRILYWSLTNSDPEAAQLTLQTIADIYVSQNIQRQSEEAHKTLEFLNQQVPLVHAELAKAEERLNAYRAGRESVNLSLETQSVLQRLVNVEAQLNELQFSEAEISRRFMPNHPTYDALLEKKQQLQRQRANIEGKIDKLPETQQEMLRLERDISVTQQIYVQLRNKVQEMQIAQASTAGNVRILDTAEVFPKPVGPNRKLILLLSIAVGAGLSIGFVLLRDLLNDGVQTQDQLEVLGLQALATVPVSKRQRKLTRKVKVRGKSLLLHTGLLAQGTPDDPAVEALRNLRTSLNRYLEQDYTALSGGKCILITSPEPRDGKSFVALNLAYLFAQIGKQVLLLDADMHEGQVHRVFREDAAPGLCELLRGEVDLRSVVRPAPVVEKLHYVSRGGSLTDPGELLANARFARVLAVAQQHYDVVVIDSAAVLKYADAAIIGTQVANTVLVTRFQRSSPPKIDLALHRLYVAGVAVTGAVLNAQESTSAVAASYWHNNPVNRQNNPANTSLVDKSVV